MMLHKTNFIKTVSGVLHTVGMAYVVMVFACAGSIILSAQAAPATLTSSDATVYEQADEGSSPVGNLVEGSSFEYTGDVTAADGSVWHQITTSSGVNGYIRGDREMEIEAEESAPEEQADSSEESGSASAETGPEDGGGGADAEAAPEEDGVGNEESAEENAGSEDNSTEAAVMTVQNNQAKKYVMNSSGKIKEREIFSETGAGIRNMKSPGAGIDKALFAGIAVVFFCAVTVHICLTRIRMLKGGTDGGETLNTGRNRTRKKTDKKKHIQKRKGKKAAMAGKKA